MWKEGIAQMLEEMYRNRGWFGAYLSHDATYRARSWDLPRTIMLRLVSRGSTCRQSDMRFWIIGAAANTTLNLARVDLSRLLSVIARRSAPQLCATIANFCIHYSKILSSWAKAGHEAKEEQSLSFTDSIAKNRSYRSAWVWVKSVQAVQAV